jgi:hypothetical protein
MSTFCQQRTHALQNQSVSVGAPIPTLATVNLPKASQANLRFPSASSDQFKFTLSPLTRKEARPCHGQLPHSSKCASASRSTAICRPSFEQVCRPRAAAGTTARLSLGSTLRRSGIRTPVAQPVSRTSRVGSLVRRCVRILCECSAYTNPIRSAGPSERASGWEGGGCARYAVHMEVLDG